MATGMGEVGMMKGMRRDAVYVSTVPLRAAKGPAQLFMSAAYSFNLWSDLQHYMVLIRPTSPPAQAVVFDFQPQDPENLYVALAALSGRQVPGVVRMRKLAKLPTRKCWFVGFSNENGINVAHKFNDHWQTDLKIGDHDCRHYTNGDSKFGVPNTTGRFQIHGVLM
ncbi:uncharacterized protein LOC131229137 isoform X2 [Magnolia sinica]|uniref:uncharacterized protein LOC131229137 isoform X2 n=1 Tax=Magnolia sinica TaxID=86752 RepID=UPI002657C4BD|nr:uncharacterized protein LOC131229137 isoform X2 [Magnolia sinica]